MILSRYGAVLDEQEKGLREAAMSVGSDIYKQADSTVRQRVAQAVEDQTKQAMDNFTSSTTTDSAGKDD